MTSSRSFISFSSFLVLLPLPIAQVSGLPSLGQQLDRRQEGDARIVDGFPYVGCTNTVTQEFVGGVYTNVKYTLEECSARCRGNTPYFGVTFANYFPYCGCLSAVDMTIDPERPAVCDRDCTQVSPVTGQRDVCGGSGSWSVYGTPPEPSNPNAMPDNYEPLGCYTDAPAHRVLDRGVDDGDLTYAKCTALCPNSVYVGLEWGRECWCGPALDPNSLKVDDSECSMPCAGDSEQVCGNDNRLTLFKRVGETEPETPSTGEYNNMGCYTDDVADRTLPALYADDAMTIEMCAEQAATAGWKFFGVQWSRECWMGNELNSKATAAAAGSCNKACGGNPAQICGGSSVMSLYALPEPESEPEPEPTSCTLTPTPAQSLGCLLRAFSEGQPILRTIETMPARAMCADQCNIHNTYNAENECKSFTWNKADDTCILYGMDSWAVMDSAIVAGSQYRNLVTDDLACYACPRIVAPPLP